MTARHAIQALKAEGLIVRRPGHGTFVAERITHRQAGRLLSFSEEMRRLGAVPRSELLEHVVRAATSQEVRRMDLPDGALVVAIERVRIADDEPIAVETAVLRGECAVALESVDLSQTSLHGALVAAGFVPTEGHGTLRAEEAGPRDAKLLALKRGAALLVERRLILDQAHRPLEFGETRYAAGRYALDFEFGVEVARRASAPARVRLRT